MSMIQQANINGVRALLERPQPKAIDGRLNYRVLCVLGKMPPDMTGEMVDLGSHHLIDNEQRSPNGWTVGHLLIRFGSLEAIQTMQARGQKFTQLTASGVSMLQVACLGNLNVTEVIDLLLDTRHQQDLGHVDDLGWSVVHVASSSSSGPKASKKMVELGWTSMHGRRGRPACLFCSSPLTCRLSGCWNGL